MFGFVRKVFVAISLFSGIKFSGITLSAASLKCVSMSRTNEQDI